MFTKYALELIKRFEGFSSKPYICPAGYPTIGYGTRIDIYPELKNKTSITREEAEKYLLREVLFIYNLMAPLVKVKIHPFMWDALISLTYNIGIARFRASTLLRKLNAKLYDEASLQFLRWVYANGKVLKGLVKRREAEKKHFDEGVRLLCL